MWGAPGEAVVSSQAVKGWKEKSKEKVDSLVPKIIHLFSIFQPIDIVFLFNEKFLDFFVHSSERIFLISTIEIIKKIIFYVSIYSPTLKKGCAIVFPSSLYARLKGDLINPGYH